MTNLAPEIVRQRLLIEGFYNLEVDESVIKKYFQSITNGLSLRMYGEPVIFSPSGLGRDENQGYDAFVPLIDSGISLYVWAEKKFLSLIIYTCKNFDEKKALEITQDFFNISSPEHFSF